MFNTQISSFKLPSYPQDALQSENAQKWFPSAFKYLNQDLGDDYNDLFKNWVKFERLKDWVSSTKGLARHNRPKELSKWILNCRYDRPGNEPQLKKEHLVQFRKSFSCWWRDLRSSGWQQKSATEDPCGKLEKERESLDRSGKNGWLSVLACLKWWGTALGDNDDRNGPLGEEWHSMVKDVSFVLNNLIAVVPNKS
ncbi:hypothetical protein EV368DRAFT_48838 [Lentinula lateritia]|uniref:Uncharacterized protein n=1 Tax=Lentinula aff. lateritia TaxID=2804960 RepID=A0ACC1TNB0_9AGAR|nr:hypothetical protein F5876DRAFT_50624 [Lentinula aff. lateritia]KAJ3848674.1 hypothetical protein EV368DRAFT_48838 [Lentinula lateritia]